MPVKTEDRPIKKIREEVIDQLVINYGHDEITLEAFESRLDIAMDTEDREELLELVADLDLKTDPRYQTNKAEKLSEDKDYFESDDDADKIFKILSSSTQNGAWSVSRKIKATSILSDFTLDFTDARFRHQEVHVELFSLLSGNTFYVPEGVRVICKAACVLGSTENSLPAATDTSGPTIVIDGIALLSSIEIKERVSLKEKWLRFAQGVKQALN